MNENLLILLNIQVYCLSHITRLEFMFVMLLAYVVWCDRESFLYYAIQKPTSEEPILLIVYRAKQMAV